MEITYTGVLQVHDCPNCGITHAIPAGFERQMLEKGRNCICPRGHTWSFMAKSRVQIIKDRDEEIIRLRARVASRNEEIEHIKGSQKALRGVTTKTKHRIANGACPCCNRSFADLAKHMKGKHPKYLKNEKS